jgi:hypothetical protein
MPKFVFIRNEERSPCKCRVRTRDLRLGCLVLRENVADKLPQFHEF